MLDAFRALGGAADNVVQREGPRGLGLFAIDATRPVLVHTPDRLLIPARHVVQIGPDLAIDALARVDDAARRFFTRYQRSFSWGQSGRASAIAWLEQMADLPRTVRGLLVGTIGLWLPAATDDALALKRFVATRGIHYRGERTLAPVLELVNHAPVSTGFDRSDGIRVSGIYPGEVCVRYNWLDPLRRYFAYGFSSEDRRAYSIPLVLPDVDGRELVVGVDLATTQAGTGIGAWLPTVRTDDRRITLSHALLGSGERPRLPRTIFRQVLSQLSPEHADGVFERVVGANRRALLRLRDELGGYDSPACHELRTVIEAQLAELGHESAARESLDLGDLGGPVA